MRSNQERICSSCSGPHFGKVDKCRKCQQKESMRKLYQDPEARARKREQQRLYRENQQVREKKRESDKRYAIARKIANAKRLAELQKQTAVKQPLSQEEIKERERQWHRDYMKRKRERLRSGPDERPPGTKRDGYWRCPGCGGKMLGSTKRCLPCALTKQDDSNEQNDRGKYQAVYAEIE